MFLSATQRRGAARRKWSLTRRASAKYTHAHTGMT
jgi:hypothetical protein